MRKTKSELFMSLPIRFVLLLIVLILAWYAYGIYNYNHGFCRKCGHLYATNQWVYNGNSFTDYHCDNCGNYGVVLDMLK